MAEDDPTPGFECIDKVMLRVRRHVVLMSRRHRALLCLAVTAAAWLLFSAPSYLFGRRACTRSMPRIFSHRGFDASEALYEVTSQRSLRDLLDGGLRSFDLDLFWTDHDPEGTPHPTPNPSRNPNPSREPEGPSPTLLLTLTGTMFVGHPPSLRRLWHLPADLVHTPLAELRSRQEVKLLSLPDLLRLLKRRQRALDQVRPRAWGLSLGSVSGLAPLRLSLPFTLAPNFQPQPQPPLSTSPTLAQAPNSVWAGLSRAKVPRAPSMAVTALPPLRPARDHGHRAQVRHRRRGQRAGAAAPRGAAAARRARDPTAAP